MRRPQRPATRPDRRSRLRKLGAGLLLGAAALGAQETAPPTPAPCSGAEHRQFDFWLGEWEVRRADGQLAGTNRIESILGGCALRESWTGARGTRGTSLNAFDRATGRWHQTWIDDQGLVLLLAGGLVDGKMTLRGERPAPEDAKTIETHRITWKQAGERRVRQLWEASRDGGATWRVLFDGTYTPASAPPPSSPRPQ